MRQVLLLSSSKVFNYEFLEYAAEDLKALLSKNNVQTVLFIPYALADHDTYLEKVQKPFAKWGFKVEGIHKALDPQKAIKQSEAIFVGGGNTFRLLKILYDLNLIGAIRNQVLQNSKPYIGSSAGTNVATKSICTTNDMPITYPPSFEALNLVPFNINPHYVDPEADETPAHHQGETRAERIMQFFEENTQARYVLGLREGATLSIEGEYATLRGVNGARLFTSGKEAVEVQVGEDLSYLLQ